MRAIHAIIFLFLAGMLDGLQIRTQAQETPPSEYQLKAAFLFNFAKFVEWPPRAFPDPDSPFVIALLGDDPFHVDLENTITGKSINGHPFIVKHLKTFSDAKKCHILFISKSERRRIPEILAAIGPAGVLTVSEVDHFLQAGGMVNFIMEGKKVRFEINDEAAKRAGLRISSKLLNLAKRSSKENR